MNGCEISGYHYVGADLNHSHGVLLPAIYRILDGLNLPSNRRRMFEIGCGNGSVAHELTLRGWDVTGVDPSVDGIANANRGYPGLKLYTGSAYDDLSAVYGKYPVVLSLEVVEHVYFPRKYAATLNDLVESGGGSHRFDALSWLLEEPGFGLDRQDGPAFYGLMGPRAYQVLVGTNFKAAFAGGGFSIH